MHGYRTIKIANLLSYYYQKHVIKYCEKSIKGPVKIFLVNHKFMWGIK